jgi:hypothetical protein
MLEVLPNLRQALLIFSGFFALFSLGVVVFTARSRAVQQGTYVFGEGQWLSIIGMFVFGLVFAFAFALPGPPQRVPSTAELRSKWFNNFNDQCLSGKSDITSTMRVDCSLLARQQADISLGIKPVLAKVVYVKVDKGVSATLRAEKYEHYYNGCMQALPGDNTPARLNYCSGMANKQTLQALGGAPNAQPAG